jgi:hypothetical protein
MCDTLVYFQVCCLSYSNREERGHKSTHFIGDTELSSGDAVAGHASIFRRNINMRIDMERYPCASLDSMQMDRCDHHDQAVFDTRITNDDVRRSACVACPAGVRASSHTSVHSSIAPTLIVTMPPY